MTDKEAMKLSLDALEADELDMVIGKDGHMVYRKEKAITALREALAQPEQRKPLTRDEISEIAAQSGAYDEQLLAFARAIEAAHNIKEQP
ncbi:MAG: hypothetical protein EBT78_11590 [Betaproteobacteria bacterium]|nr:hypothetical protein [Betaproteobacteria bacterium]NBT68390.1 hypothetical protein [Betaproteobacteria bacterium]